MKRLSSSSNGNYSCSKFGRYGTFIFRRGRKGFWRFQTDYPPLVKHMRLRDWNSKSPWKVTGWGTSWIFRREFSGRHEAHRSVRSHFRKIGVQEILLSGSEILKPCENVPMFDAENKSDLKGVLCPKPPPMTRKNQDLVVIREACRERKQRTPGGLVPEEGQNEVGNGCMVPTSSCYGGTCETSKESGLGINNPHHPP